MTVLLRRLGAAVKVFALFGTAFVDDVRFDWPLQSAVSCAEIAAARIHVRLAHKLRRRCRRVVNGTLATLDVIASLRNASDVLNTAADACVIDAVLDRIPGESRRVVSFPAFRSVGSASGRMVVRELVNYCLPMPILEGTQGKLL